MYGLLNITVHYNRDLIYVKGLRCIAVLFILMELG